MKERKPQPAAIEVDEECASPTSLGLGRLRPGYAWRRRHEARRLGQARASAELRGSEARPAAYFGSISPLVHTGTRTRGTPALPAAGTLYYVVVQASLKPQVWDAATSLDGETPSPFPAGARGKVPERVATYSPVA